MFQYLFGEGKTVPASNMPAEDEVEKDDDFEDEGEDGEDEEDGDDQDEDE